jgi:RNA polymerase sigma-70 factor (ECF subfamily)
MESNKKDPDGIEHLAVEAGRDVEAFSELYRYYQPKIFRYVLSRVGSTTDAEDITASTFEKALKSIERYDPAKARFFTWLYKIASNTTIDYLRKTKEITVGVDDIGESFRRNGSFAEKEVENYVALVQLMQEIPRSYQEVLVLRYFEEFSIGDIADILGCSKGNVSTRLYRGQKALGALLEKKGLYEARQWGQHDG